MQVTNVKKMKNHLKIYCKESSIHGLNYIVKNDAIIVEKVIWIAAVFVSLICCGILIFKIGAKYQEDAILTYTSDKAISVTDVREF